MNTNIAEFIIFIINEVADRKGIYPSQVYKAMEGAGCITHYLVPCYDVLHTMGAQALVEDVLDFVRRRGGTL